MDYRITTYKEGYIEDQFKIGSKLYDPWPMGGQTRPDQLKELYAAEDFDPETRFYAFDGDEMVGFLTSSFKEKSNGKTYYFFEFPYVIPEHAPKAERQLIAHAFNALKDKGADVLVSRAGEYWGKSLFYAEEYGFDKKEDIARRGEINLNTADATSYGDPDNLVDFNGDKHIPELAILYADKFETSPDQMAEQLQRWKKLSPGNSFKSPWDHTLTLLTHKIAEKDNEVIGRIVGMNHSNFDKDTINFSQMIIKPGYDQVVSDFLAELIRTGQEYDKSKLVLHTGQWGVSPDDSMFEQFNISFEMKLAYFEKEL